MELAAPLKEARTFSPKAYLAKVGPERRLRSDALIAPFVLDGPINHEAFEVYVEQVLVPELRPGDVVIMDNLSSHKGPRVQEMIETKGARLLFLPP